MIYFYFEAIPESSAMFLFLSSSAFLVIFCHAPQDSIFINRFVPLYYCLNS